MGTAAESLGVIDNSLVPPKKSDGTVVNAKVRSFRATLDLSRADITKTSGQSNLLFRKPRGHVVRGFRVVSSVSLGTTTLAIGITGTTDKYAAAKAYGTTADAAVPYQKATTLDDDALDTEEDIILTWGTADAPGTGIVVVHMETTSR